MRSSILASAARIWLTRTFRPFEFTSEYEDDLPFSECDDLGLYIHIPFCRRICKFCPYCKTYYQKEICDRYIDALIKEIHMVGRKNKAKKKVTSLYFGGGTPALAAERLPEIISAVKEHFDITKGIGIELHPDNVTVSLLTQLISAGVTKISIGIQSFAHKYANILGREPADIEALKYALSKVKFDTVSIDLIFALPKQTFADIKKDIDTAFYVGGNHVAIYPFIDFTFTKSKIPAMSDREKKKLLERTVRYCTLMGYERTSIWTFSSEKEAEYSSMTRDNFLGFGCSATTLLKDRFKINTFSVKEYCRRINREMLPTSLTIHFTKRQRMVYYLFWKLYSTRLDPVDFERFFGTKLSRMYGAELFLGECFGLLERKNGKYHLTDKGTYYYHYFENFYTLSYIDKMWGIMRKRAFPDKMILK